MKKVVGKAIRLAARLASKERIVGQLSTPNDAAQSVLTGDVVLLIAGLDAYRHQLADGDPVLLARLGDIEMECARRLGRGFREDRGDHEC